MIRRPDPETVTVELDELRGVLVGSVRTTIVVDGSAEVEWDDDSERWVVVRLFVKDETTGFNLDVVQDAAWHSAVRQIERDCDDERYPEIRDAWR